RRRVHQLVDQTLRKRVEYLGGLLAAGKHTQRAIELLAARLIGTAAQRADQRHALTRLHPVHELPDLAVDDDLGLRDRRAARVDVGAHDLSEIVDAVEEHVIELGRFGLDIARYGEVDHENGAAAARAQRALDQAFT